MNAQQLSTVLVGSSAVMSRLRDLVGRLAPVSLPVLVQGETGTGKDLVARALHQASRRPGAFVPLNVCAIADGMFEASLFGHVRGAFTGAVAHSPGYLAEANAGTLFLDEIGGLPLAAQAKLLRAVETKEFRQIGARVDRRSEFRLVSASNESLEALVGEGRFRADLLQRLGGIRLLVPPLRDRREDIPELVTHFARMSRERPEAHFTTAAVRRLQAHQWPGNVRELRHVVDCAVALARAPEISRDDLEPLIGLVSRAVGGRRAHREDALISALADSGWDVDEAARRLDVHRATIYRRLKRLGVFHPGSDRETRTSMLEPSPGDESHSVAR